jgi:hypothetical protein
LKFRVETGRGQSLFWVRYDLMAKYGIGGNAVEDFLGAARAGEESQLGSLAEPCGDTTGAERLHLFLEREVLPDRARSGYNGICAGRRYEWRNGWMKQTTYAQYGDNWQLAATRFQLLTRRQSLNAVMAVTELVPLFNLL